MTMKDEQAQTEKQEVQIPERRAKQLQIFSENVMREEAPPLNNIFIDFDCFQDFNLGTILSMIDTQVEFDYIQSKLPEYCGRYDNKIAKYFPALDITEEQVKEKQQDENEQRYIAALSPMTEFFYQFAYESSELVQRRQPYSFSKDLGIYLLFKRIPPDVVLQKKWKIWAQDLFEQCSVYFVFGNIQDRGNEFYGTMDYVVVEDIEKLITIPSVDKAMMVNGDYIDKQIRAPYIVNEDLIDPETTDYGELITNTEKILRAVSDFQFISRKLVEGG